MDSRLFTSNHSQGSFLITTNLKTLRKIKSIPRLTRNPEIIKGCEQWENSRVLESRGAFRSLRNAKIIWDKVGGGLAVESAKTRESVRVSSVLDLKM